jgi:hypothetical protein
MWRDSGIVKPVKPGRGSGDFQAPEAVSAENVVPPP